MTPCIFLPNKPEKSGYVQVGRSQPGRERLAHRRAYVDAYGAIPEGHQVDHECHNQDWSCGGGPSCKHRACVNPEHLVARWPGDNTRASDNTLASYNLDKTHCSNGHEFTDKNTYIGPTKGDRQCRMCKLKDYHRSKEAEKMIEWGLA